MTTSRRRSVLLTLVLLCGMLLEGTSQADAAALPLPPKPCALVALPRPGAAASTVEIVAVGDIAASGGDQAATARLTAQLDPDRVLLLGDLAYNSGELWEFDDRYDPYWGRFNDIAWPVPGNHEWDGNLEGYRDYFGVRGVTWWARDIGAWTVIGLDSEVEGNVNQIRFLRRVLERRNGRPAIVIWHRPRFSLGEHGDSPSMQTLWRIAANDRDVRFFLWAHDHVYERMNLRSPNGHRVQAFVVGTGGAELTTFPGESRRISRQRIAGVNGVLDLTLTGDGWHWEFVSTSGDVLDSGDGSL